MFEVATIRGGETHAINSGVTSEILRAAEHDWKAWIAERVLEIEPIQIQRKAAAEQELTDSRLHGGINGGPKSVVTNFEIASAWCDDVLAFKIRTFSKRSETIGKPEASRVRKVTDGACDVAVDRRGRRHVEAKLPPDQEMRITERAYRSFKFNL